MAKVRKMFPGGNTSQGFYSLHDNIIGSNRNMLYILKGMPGGGKSSLMKEIAKRLVEEGYMVEYHHCPSDPNSVDGIVMTELAIAIVDGTAPHVIDPTYPGLTDRIIDLGRFIDPNLLKSNEDDIKTAKMNNKYSYKKAFNYFKAASVIYNDIQEEIQRNINQKAINTEIRNLKDIVLSKKEIDVKSNGFKERYLFSTAYTPEGFVDYTNNILEHISDVYYIKGEIGIDESLLFNSLLDESRLRNYHVEIYLNSLMPNIIESLFIKELDTIITSNQNGEDFGRKIIDLNYYLDTSKKNIDDYYLYNMLIDKGVQALSRAKENHFILEKSYGIGIDYSEINKIREDIYNEILSYSYKA